MSEAAAEKPFRKDLSHLTWDEVYARQERRAALVGPWMDGARLEPGDRILEIGAGPGYVSFVLADRVGPSGLVYAVDRSADALKHLERRRKERRIEQIRPILADAAALEPRSLPADAALITMVLHHADDPAGILRAVGGLLPPRTLTVIGEFHPDGPCEQGPPREHRLAPAQIEAWCEQAGFTVVAYRRQAPEYYMTVARRRP